MSELVTLDAITDASTFLEGAVVRTPLLDTSHWTGGPLALKLENLQPVGAFKIRGAMVAIGRIPPDRRHRGVVAHSSGNHAQAVAFAAKRLGIPATIVIPHGAAERKVAATAALGADVVRVPAAERSNEADRILARTGASLVPPFDHLDVIAGQGTVGLEIARDAPDVDVVLVPVSGGGLISGVAAAVKALRPAARVVGVEPELAADAQQSLRRAQRTAWSVADVARTIADGLRVPEVGELPWEHLHRLVDDIVTVSEAEIIDATVRLVLHARVVAEPSGAVTTAAWLHRRTALPAGRTVAVVSGGNVDPEWLAAALSGSAESDAALPRSAVAPSGRLDP